MNPATVVIIVDHPLRDLGGCVLIAKALAEKGCRVVLCPMAFQEEICFTLVPDMVLINYIRNNNFHFIKKLKSARIKVGLLDTEGGFYGDLSKYTKVLCTREGILDDIDLFLAWGHKMHDYWLNTIGIDRDRVALTGVARFDLYHPSILKKVKFELGASELNGQKILLFNTKVPLANPQFQTVEKEKKLYRHLGFSDSEIETIHRTGIESIESLSSLITITADAFPQQKIVVRPHPHENISTYRDKFTGLSTILVSRTNDLVGWLALSQAVVHRHCTTAIEAALAGVPAISPQWVPTIAQLPDGEAISYRPQSADEFKELIGTLKTSGLPLPDYARPVLERTVHDWLFQFDGKSHERIAQAVLQALPDKKTVLSDVCAAYSKQIYINRTDTVGKILHLSEATRFTHGLARALKLRKWLKTEKSFSRSSILNFIDGDSLRITTKDNSYQIIEAPHAH